MAVTALPLPTRILMEADRTVSFQTIAAQFGDGYEQVAPKGLNNRKESWSITWAGLTLAEKNTIVAVLNSVGTWGILSWTPCTESISANFRLVDGYKVTQVGGSGVFSITAGLKKVYDIT